MTTGDNLELKQIQFLKNYDWHADGYRTCILFWQKGQTRFFSAEASLLLETGDVFVLSRNGVGKFAPLEKDGASARRFLFSLESLVPLLGFGEVCLMKKMDGNLDRTRHYPASSAFAQQCHELISRTPAPASLEHRAHLLNVAARLLSEEFRQVPLNGDATGEFVNWVNRLTLEDVQKLSVEELAKRLGYSRRHLNRLFHETLGCSVAQVKMEARLLKAVFLLQNPSVKVIDVAMECGFNHLGLFSQCFRKRFSLSPNQWRQREFARRNGQALSALPKPDCKLATSGMCLWNYLNNASRVPLELDAASQQHCARGTEITHLAS